MTELPPETPPSSQTRIGIRIAGCVVLVLGSCCLWLAWNGPAPDSASATDDEWSEQSPRLFSARRSDRPLQAEITDVYVTPASSKDDDSTVIRALHEAAPGEASRVEPVGHSSTPRGAAGAWLTGDIEDEGTSAEVPAEFEMQIPAWKRTTKSLRSALRSAARPAGW